MIRITVLGIALDSLGQHIVLLKPVDEVVGEGVVLPIWIGGQEATSTLIGINGEDAPRPLGHDLMKTLLDTFGARLQRVDITRLDEGTFYADLVLQTVDGQRTLDARPSDSIALAVRAGAPIFVADDVLDEAGIPAELVEVEDDDEVPAGGARQDETDEERLEEFQKFLDDVDPDDFRG
ncbi:bifunctional nuclease family protein [Agromyces protaetiae]|uniref:Bifunctional nuclease family protein n=1 Tax=Agromyces protaetiae TaxID=2509455 RepID=A0A4V0YGQ8_9MICO|nr:bifunctional nuclease family protein [Agromyces protaetiae]QAY72061.1 bifunctional nuclease family protein [Agromyces protaetiae]